MKEKENNKEGDTKDYLKVRDLRNRSYRLPSSTAKPKDKKGDSNKRIENMPGNSQSSQDHHSASMMREIRDEVTKQVNNTTKNISKTVSDIVRKECSDTHNKMKGEVVEELTSTIEAALKEQLAKDLVENRTEVSGRLTTMEKRMKEMDNTYGKAFKRKEDQLRGLSEDSKAINAKRKLNTQKVRCLQEYKDLKHKHYLELTAAINTQTQYLK